MEIFAYCPRGYEGELIRVEVDLRRGIPGIDLVGLPDSAVRESRERVRAAIRNAGFQVPRQRVLLNLSPAGIRKAGAGYDLALASAILGASGQVDGLAEERTLVLGELSLSGSVLPVAGMEAAVQTAAEVGISRFLVPKSADIGRVPSGKVRRIGHLREFLDPDFRFVEPLGKTSAKAPVLPAIASHLNDLQWMPGLSRLALAVSMVGGHHLFLVGPPGTGKSSFLRVLQDFRPPLLSNHEAELRRIRAQFAGGAWTSDGTCPVRRPHSTTSFEGMFGGGRNLQPGEVSAAHGGFLVLDEIQEFGSKTLAGLRIPMEEGSVGISRAHISTRYPCEFTLWAAANLCPCGSRGRPGEICLCDPRQIHRYWSVLGAALGDRFDIRLLLPHQDSADLPGWLSDLPDLSARVVRARARLNSGPRAGASPGLPGRWKGVDLARQADGDRRASGKGFRDWCAVRRLAYTISLLDDAGGLREEHIDLAARLRTPVDERGYLRDFVGA